MRIIRSWAVGLLALAVLLVIAVPASGAADARRRLTTGLKLTLVARQCPQYSDVMANLARDDNMQSLQDLGKDSVYTAGEPVSPAVEAANDANCTPLTGWKFTLGSGIGANVQDLATVTPSPDGLAQPVTEASTPLLDTLGNPTGQTLAGATTLTLDSALTTVANNRRLQIMGGTPTDPLNHTLFGNTYSFATLRCAIDNQRADNVDRAAYPTAESHVFCYYYAVKQAAEPGSVVIRKVLRNSTTAHDFTYTGNLSYNVDKSFSLTAGQDAPGEQTFVRASTAQTGTPWTATEDTLAGWTLVSLDCDSAQGTSRTTVQGATATITLAAQDTVTCTYTNAPSDTVGELRLRKRTLGAAGGPFSFATSGTAIGTATTTVEGTSVPAGTAHLDLGTHTITETLPTSTTGTWTLTSATCDGTPVHVDQASRSFPVLVTTRDLTCTVTNTFHPGAHPSPTLSPAASPLPGTGPQAGAGGNHELADTGTASMTELFAALGAVLLTAGGLIALGATRRRHTR